MRASRVRLLLVQAEDLQAPLDPLGREAPTGPRSHPLVPPGPGAAAPPAATSATTASSSAAAATAAAATAAAATAADAAADTASSGARVHPALRALGLAYALVQLVLPLRPLLVARFDDKPSVVHTCSSKSTAKQWDASGPNGQSP